MTTAISTLTVEELHTQLSEVVVVDVRTPGEYASGHVPGARNIPLDRLSGAVGELRTAAETRRLVVVCASGARSANACASLSGAGVHALNLTGGTSAWVKAGHPVERPEGAVRNVWPMDRQVRLVAGSLVLLGFALSLVIPYAWLLSLAIGAGLTFSGASGTCGMAYVLGKLPFNKAA